MGEVTPEPATAHRSPSRAVARPTPLEVDRGTGIPAPRLPHLLPAPDLPRITEASGTT